MSEQSRAIFKEANQHLHGLSHKENRVYWQHIIDPDDEVEGRATTAEILKDAADVLYGAGLRLVRVRVQENVITAEVNWLSAVAQRASRNLDNPV